ncbi:SpoIID/LytB domain-containing protein [Chengkuizengella marina]|uniref:Sporulation stage II protein D amidase enhancer LytB N-terminal domain-containing protein n=1 Tax=Chengkuizengella marina TaxID=2507566 RepID=A0A6N9Q282_9BACL|nr:SpoIID/LytB domain-containing protein [Chengkuizengella marina]NBI28584.1 hypothetical protein [Chengkuizengella marina]
MKKKVAATILALSLVIPSAFASTNNEVPIVDRPSNATPGLPPVLVGPTEEELKSKYGITTEQLKKAVESSSESSKMKNSPQGAVPPELLDLVEVEIYPEPKTIKVSIYDLSSTKAEISGTYKKTVTVNFETYVKDVLPNEWRADWGNSASGKNSLRAGALAVKTFGWFHVVDWKKDPDRGAHVTNGTKSQVYIAGSRKTNTNAAVDYVDEMVIGKRDSFAGKLYETGYRANASDNGTLMSQYGSYDMALDGYSYRKIIEHFYRSYDLVVRDQTVWVNSGLID